MNDKQVRYDFNACMTLGMTTYNALRQVAAVHGITAENVRESLKRTEYDTDARD
jgi:hypothetical protein